MSTAIASGQNRMPAGDSRYTELCGMLVALEQYIRSRRPEELSNRADVEIINDNQGSIQVAKGVTCPEDCSPIVREIRALAQAHNLNLSFQWQPRDSELMQRADYLTKPKDATDWHLDRTALTDTVRPSPIPSTVPHRCDQETHRGRQHHEHRVLGPCK